MVRVVSESSRWELLDMMFADSNSKFYKNELGILCFCASMSQMLLHWIIFFLFEQNILAHSLWLTMDFGGDKKRRTSEEKSVNQDQKDKS